MTHPRGVPKSPVDGIMRLAYELADAKAEHAIAVKEFASMREEREWADIQLLAQKWQEAEKALRTAVEKAVT